MKRSLFGSGEVRQTPFRWSARNHENALHALARAFWCDSCCVALALRKEAGLFLFYCCCCCCGVVCFPLLPLLVLLWCGVLSVANTAGAAAAPRRCVFRYRERSTS